MLLGLVALNWRDGASTFRGQDPAVPQHRFSETEVLPTGQAPIRIVALGTSLTRNALWPDDLARALTVCSGRPVLVTRIAEVGENSAWGLTQVQAVAAMKPDLVLIEFAINDADLRDGQSLDAALDAHQQLLDALAAEAPAARPVLMTMNRAFGLRGLLRPWLRAHDAQYRRLAAERHIGLIDLAPLWAAAPGTGQDGALLLPDGLHPTDAAVAHVAFPTLVTELGRRLPGCA
jgi:lysophospholipase L1-like esterase